MIGADWGAALGGGLGTAGATGPAGAAGGAAEAGKLEAAASVITVGGGCGGGVSGWIIGGPVDMGPPLVSPWEKPREKSAAGLAGRAEVAGLEGLAGIGAAGTEEVPGVMPLIGLGTVEAGPEVGRFGRAGDPVADRGETGGSLRSPGIEGKSRARGVATSDFGTTTL
ncbi:MAG: hypothetical protein QOH57_2127, partial [Mycobacterium sp.]|nr:hypothetical protein [Mycobacterium sp.]